MGRVYKSDGKNQILVHSQCDRCGAKAPAFMDVSKWMFCSRRHGSLNVDVVALFCPNCFMLDNGDFKPGGTIKEFSLRTVNFVPEEQLVNPRCRLVEVEMNQEIEDKPTPKWKKVLQKIGLVFLAIAAVAVIAARTIIGKRYTDKGGR